MEGTRQEAAVVQEMDVPEGYVVQPEDRPTAGAPFAPIPVIDMGLLLSQQQQTADVCGGEAAKLRSALESWGIFMVTNHGVEACVMDAMCSASREFFQQPIEEKMKYSTGVVDGEDNHQGYANRHLKSSGDWSDRLFLQVEPPEERKLNLWPKSFRDILRQYSVQQCDLVNKGLLPAMASLLGLRDDYFLQSRASTYARLAYYPSCPRPDLVLGAKSHSDASLITVLMVDNNVGGLQVLKDGVWYDVPAPSHPHALLIFIGDTAEIISNGAFKSSVHRVVTNSQKERTSVVMFYVPHLEEIGPADELVDDTHPARFKKVKSMDYVALHYEHYKQSFRGMTALDTVRLI